MENTEKKAKTLTMFCAHEQKDTEHSVDIDLLGEIVLTCTSNLGTEEEPQECGRFLKLPRGTTADELKAYCEAHKQANNGQVSLESIEAEKAKLLEGLL